MVDAPGLRNWPFSSGRPWESVGVTRSMSRRRGTDPDWIGALNWLPDSDGIAAEVPVGETPTAPPVSGVGASVYAEPPVTWLPTSTGTFKIACSSRRSGQANRVVMSNDLPPSVIWLTALPPTADWITF